ncbi:hypothetical protein BGZ83_009220 [Gryganskiella cystojenkinii]|nr:hypothetical protein BGZ83_009220 [Gryganskiella cystojenkinii]
MERDPFLNRQGQQQLQNGSLTDEQAFAMMNPQYHSYQPQQQQQQQQPYLSNNPAQFPPHLSNNNALGPRGESGGRGGGGGGGGGGAMSVISARSESGGAGGGGSNSRKSFSPDNRISQQGLMMMSPHSSLQGYSSPGPGSVIGGQGPMSVSGGSVVNFPLDHHMPMQQQQQQQQLQQQQGYYPQYQQLQSQPQSSYQPYLQLQRQSQDGFYGSSPFEDARPHSPFGSKYSLVSGSGSSVAGGNGGGFSKQPQYAMQPLKEKASYYPAAPLVDLGGASTPILRSAPVTVNSDKDETSSEGANTVAGDPPQKDGDTEANDLSRISHARRSQDLSDNDDEEEEEGQERGSLRKRDSKRCWCCSRRLCVYMTFLFVILLGIVLFFVVPRSPGFSFVSVASMGDPVVTRNEFSEPFSVQIRVDNSENFLPLRLNSMDMNVWMKIDMTKIGNNDNLPSSFTFKPKQIQTISVPMMIDYTSLRIDTNTDGTFQQLISACKPVPAGGTVQGINLTFGGKLHVWGLSWVWKPQFSFNVDNVPCPINARDPTLLPPPPSPPTPAPVTSVSGGATASGTATASASRTSTTANAQPTTTSSVATPTQAAR